MSVVLTSSIHLHASQLPFGALPLTDLAIPYGVLSSGGLKPLLVDGQSLSYNDWVAKLKSGHPKVVVLVLDDAFLLSIKSLKKDLGDVVLVVCTHQQDLLSPLVFDFEIDFVCFDTGYASLPDLIRTIQNAFAPFYDHISGIAYKNGAGTLTKTEITSKPQPGPWVIPEELLKGYGQVLLGSGLELPLGSEVQIIQETSAVLKDWTAYQNSVVYDRFVLRLSSSKQALQTLRDLLETQQPKKEVLHVYPSCDLAEDQAYYHRIGEALQVHVELKESSFIKRFLLRRKLKNLLKT